MAAAPPIIRRLLDQVDAFRSVGSPNAATDRAVMQVCYDALQRYVSEMRPDDILRALREGSYIVEVEGPEALETQVLAPLRDGDRGDTFDVRMVSGRTEDD